MTAGFEFVTRSQAIGRWPSLTARVDQAHAASGHVLPACRHVLAAGSPPLSPVLPFAIICAVCCDRVCCKNCHNDHIGGAHTDAIEHTCDGCGDVVERITPVSMMVSLATRPVRVRGLDGRKRKVVAPLAVAGLGLCRRCQPGVAS
jgi:hypothetical protein